MFKGVLFIFFFKYIQSKEWIICFFMYEVRGVIINDNIINVILLFFFNVRRVFVKIFF